MKAAFLLVLLVALPSVAQAKWERVWGDDFEGGKSGTPLAGKWKQRHARHFVRYSSLQAFGGKQSAMIEYDVDKSVPPEAERDAFWAQAAFPRKDKSPARWRISGAMLFDPVAWTAGAVKITHNDTVAASFACSNNQLFLADGINRPVWFFTQPKTWYRFAFEIDEKTKTFDFFIGEAKDSWRNVFRAVPLAHAGGVPLQTVDFRYVGGYWPGNAGRKTFLDDLLVERWVP